MRKLIPATLCLLSSLATIPAQDLFIGSYRLTTSNFPTDWLRVYSSAAGGSVTSHNPSPIGAGDQVRRPLLAVEKGGVVYLFNTGSGGLGVSQYISGGTPSVTPLHLYPAGVHITNGRALVFSPKRDKLYVGDRDGTLTYGSGSITGNTSFGAIYEVDLSTLPTSFSTPVRKIVLGSPTAPNECYDLDVHPNGTIYAACYGELLKPGGLGPNLTAINVSGPGPGWTTTSTPLPNSATSRGVLRVEPTLGAFAYITDPLANSLHRIDLPFAVPAVTATILHTNSLTGVDFHSSGAFAYTISNLGEIFRIQSTSSLINSTLITASGKFPATWLFAGNNLYVVEWTPTGSNDKAELLIRNAISGGAALTTPQKALLVDNYPSDGGTIQGLAVIEAAVSRITARVDPTLPNSLNVSLNNNPPANSTSISAAPGLQVPIDVNSPQPASGTTGPRYSFTNWVKNSTCPAPNWSPLPPIPQTDPAVANQDDVYTACFSKEWFIRLATAGAGVCPVISINNMTLTNGGGIWVKQGDPVLTAATPPALGSRTISPPSSFAATADATVTVTCIPPPPLCITAPKSGNLLTWYTLDDLSAPLTNRGNGPAHSAVFVGAPTLGLASGKVAGGLNTSSGFAEATNAAEGDIGTGDFSIDLWIRTSTGTTNTSVHTFLDKRQTSAGTLGYSFFQYQGRLGFQMATGGPFSNFFAPVGSVNVADGQWHLVAVTVDRDQSNGGRLYVDGNVVLTFNPTTLQTSLSNTARLRLGAQAGTVFSFNGSIDEVEIFNTVLDASDVQAIFAAQDAGKCKPVVYSVTIVNQNCPLYTTNPAALGGVTKVNAGSPFTLQASTPPPFVLTSLTASSGQTGSGNNLSIPSVNGNTTVTLTCSVSPQCIPPPSNMTGWYPLDELTGPASSIAGALTPATWLNSPTPIAAGRVAGALRFNGSNHLQAANPAQYNIANAISFDMWLRFTGTNRMAILDKRQPGSPSFVHTGYELFVINGLPRFSINNGGPSGTVAAATGPAINDGQWHLLVVTARQSGTSLTVNFYVDGQPRGNLVTNLAGSLVNARPLLIGRNLSAPMGSWYAGDLDELEIFDRELTALEAMQLFAAGTNGKCRPVTPVVVSLSSTPITNVGIIVNAGGTPVNTNTNVTLNTGTTHTLVAPTPVDRSGTRYALATFGGQTSPTLTLPNFTGTPTSIVADYTPTHYELCVTMQAVFGNPYSFGVSPASMPIVGKPGCFWQLAGSTASVILNGTVAGVQPQYRLNFGPLTSMGPTLSVAMNGPKYVDISFQVTTSTAHLPYTVTPDSSGQNAQIRVTVTNNGPTLLRNVASSFTVSAGFAIVGLPSTTPQDLVPSQSYVVVLNVTKTGTALSGNLFPTTTGLNLIGVNHVDATSLGFVF